MWENWIQNNHTVDLMYLAMAILGLIIGKGLVKRLLLRVLWIGAITILLIALIWFY